MDNDEVPLSCGSVLQRIALCCSVVQCDAAEIVGGKDLTR